MIKLILSLLFLAVSLPAVEVGALVGLSAASPHLATSAKVHDLVMFGAEVSTGRTLQYVAGFSCFEVPGSHVQSYGVTPLGGHLNLFPRRRVRPFLLADGGIVASTRPIPIPRRDATGLNFLVDFGAGVKIGRAAVGYKLLHISNADTTRYNPGLSAWVLFGSYRIH